jgi:DNA-binding NtrC family response regulator
MAIKMHIIVCSQSDAVLASIKAGMNPSGRLDRVDFDTIPERVKACSPDFLFLDLKAVCGHMGHPLATEDFKVWLETIRRYHPSIQVIAITPPECGREAVLTVKAGARTYLKTPIEPEEIRLITQESQKELSLESELDYLREQFWEARRTYARSLAPVATK